MLFFLQQEEEKSGSHLGRTHRLCVMSAFICCDGFYSQSCVFICQLAWDSFITICLVSQAPDPLHPSLIAGSAVPPSTTPPPLLESCITLCSLFKPVTEETNSDKDSIGATPHHEPGYYDMRWMVLQKPSGRLRGRTGNEST